MRILTRTQYDAICDIVTEQKKRIEELEADLEKRKAQVKDLEESIRKKDETIDYLNDRIFVANDRYATVLRNMSVRQVNVDFPATTKQPEDKLF